MGSPFSPLWPALLPSPSLKHTVDTMVVDTDTTEARGPLMPNPRLKLMPLPNPMLMLGATDITAIPTDTDTDMDIPTVITAKDLLMPNLRLRLTHGEDIMADTDMAVDTMVDTVDTIMVELLKKPLKLPSGSSHSNSFNLATIPSIF